MLKRQYFKRSIEVLGFLFKRNIMIAQKGLAPKTMFFFSESNFDGIESLENLEDPDHHKSNVSKALLKCQTIEQIMDYIDEQKKTKKLYNEKFYILRMIGRLARKSQKDDFKARYYQFMKEDIINCINTFDHLSTFLFIYFVNIFEFVLMFPFSDMLDFIFFYRNMRRQTFPHCISFEQMIKVQKKMEDLFPQYSFRNLINLYYDFSLCYLQFNGLGSEIMSRIRQNKDTFTPFQAVMILKAANTNKFNLKNYDHQIISRVVSYFEISNAEFDVNQKCIIFQAIASLDLFYLGEKKLFPISLFLIHDEMLQKINELAENNVINILKAYIFLPPSFSKDLINALHESMMSTLEKNSGAVNTSFLLKYLEIFVQINRQSKLDIKIMEVLTKEIVARMKNEDILSKPQILGRILKIYFNFKNEEIIQITQQHLREIINKEDNCFLNLEFLAQHKCDIEEFLDIVLY